MDWVGHVIVIHLNYVSMEPRHHRHWLGARTKSREPHRQPSGSRYRYASACVAFIPSRFFHCLDRFKSCAVHVLPNAIHVAPASYGLRCRYPIAHCDPAERLIVPETWYSAFSRSRRINEDPVDPLTERRRHAPIRRKGGSMESLTPDLREVKHERTAA
jgi:hypothetical protein